MSTRPNSFKTWLREEDEALTGVTSIIKTTIDGFKQSKTDTIDKTAKVQAKNKEVAKSDITKAINQHIASLFTKFPDPDDAGGPEDILARFPSRDSALQAFAIYKNMAKTITEIQTGFNKRLVQTKKIAQPELNTLLKSAKQDADSGILEKDIEAFAKSEAAFFIDLLKIPESDSDAFTDMKMDKAAFISRLSNRFGKTQPAKIKKTIIALNTLFIYLSTEFTQYAKTIGEAGKQRPQG